MAISREFAGLRGVFSQSFLRWVVFLLLGLATVYALLFFASQLGVSFFVLVHRGMVKYTVGSSLFSSALDGLVWGAAVFVVAVLVLVSAVFRRGVLGRGVWLSVFSFVFLGLAGFGVFGSLFLALASVWLLGLCLWFGGVCFGVSRLDVLKGLFFGVTMVYLLVAFGALLLYNVPVLLNVSGGGLPGGLHWWLAELSMTNLFYPLLPYAYLLFVLLGVAGFFWVRSIHW